MIRRSSKDDEKRKSMYIFGVKHQDHRFIGWHEFLAPGQSSSVFPLSTHVAPVGIETCYILS